MSLFNRVLNIGIDNELDFYQRRETKSLNLFASLTLMGSSAGTATNIVLGELFPAIVIVFELLISLTTLILNYRRLFSAAPLVYIIGLNITLFLVNGYFDDAGGNYIYYFPNIIFIALLHNPLKDKRRDFLFLFIIITSFVCSRLPFFPPQLKANLSPAQYQNLFTINLFQGVLFTASMMYLLIRLINQQYSELTALLKQSEKDKLIIENSLNEKDVLLAEIQHRVKNNLSVLIGLFNLQKSSTDNKETKDAIREAKNRVLSIAMVHEKLYRRDNLSRINLKNYLSELTHEIIRSHPMAEKITIKEELEEIMADITKAVPIGLIVNESLTNSLKHGFDETAYSPVIQVSLTTHFGVISIKVSDNGRGFPLNQQRSDKSLGLTLIESLADQIDGEVRYSNNEGATVKLSLPV